MLYLIETNDHGTVQDVIACNNGIDEALERLAGAFSHPEEDDRVAYDVATARWADAVSDAEGDPTECYRRFVMDRRGFPTRFGLAAF